MSHTILPFSIGNEISSVMSQVDTIKEICAEEAYQQDFIATFDLLGKTIQQHLAAKAIGEARRVVAMVKAQIEKMPEGYWRTRHLDELKRRFGHVLDGKRTKGVPLVG